MDKPITLCDRCDIYMRCLLNYDGPACRRNRTVEPTNADRIRAMTDEELAKLLADAQCPSDLGGTDKCENPPPQTRLDSILCRECWLDWLRQEAT